MSTNLPPRSIPPEQEQGSAAPVPGKDQYSLDEMMKALREKEREKESKGEVVTRSDGTIARKVKRRKRRSEQPEKDTPEKGKKRLLVKVIIAATLVLALVLTALFLIFKQNSRGYQQEIETLASEWTGAEVELNGFKRLPLSCDIQEAKFKWDGRSYVRDFEMKRISGDVNFLTYLGRRPTGLQLGGGVGEMTLQMPTSSSSVGESLEEDGFPFSFEQYYCSALDVNFGDSGLIGLKGASTSLRYLSNDGFQVTLDQGFFQLDGWEDFPIATGLIRFDDDEIDLKSLSLEQSNDDRSPLGSNLKIAGKIPLRAGEIVQLKAETGQFSLRSLLGKRLGRFFGGTVISSTGAVVFTMGNDEIDEIVMDFKADNVKMEGFPFFSNLHDLFPEQNFDELEFNGGISEVPIVGTLRVRPEGVAIEGLQMAKKGKIRLKGGIIIGKSGKIGGKIDLWVNRFFISTRFPNSPLLTGSENIGFVKLQFRLGGTITEPDDTFRNAFGINTGLTRPSGNGPDKEQEDLWKDFQDPVDDLTPDILRNENE